MEPSSGIKATLTSVIKNKMTPIILVLIAMCVFASVFSPYFLTAYNLGSLVRDIAFIGLITLGQACLLLIGEIDLSVGNIAALCGVVGGMLMVFGKVNPFLALALCLVLGAVLGFINGTIVTRLKLNSMVVTIGMSGVYAGLNLVMTKGKAVENIPKDIYFLGQGFLFGIPMPFVIMLILMIIVLFLVKFTQFGRYLYAIGNNKEAAKILGIKVNIIRTLAFSLTGLLSALAGILMVSRLGTSQPSIGTDWPLNSIAASVIGGVSMTGGLGNPFGAFIGATIICVISNLIVLFGVDPYWQTAVSGIVVVVAISIDSISMMMAAKQKLIKKLKDN